MSITHVEFGYLETPYLTQPYLTAIEQGTMGMQFNVVIEDSSAVGMQFEVNILDFIDAEGMQFEVQIAAAAILGLQFIKDDLSHTLCFGTGYLEDPYLEDPYLVNGMCANLGMQFEVSITDFTDAEGMQFNTQVDTQDAEGIQFEVQIDTQHAEGLQFEAISLMSTGFQFETVFYNTNLLRILCDFPSRGTTGTNWTSNSTEPGDFSVNNLNTDIVEQVWRSAAGDVTGINLTCDTEVPQGVFMDTFAILGHNLTTSANITILGSNTSDFSIVGVSIPLASFEENIIYIAPDFPTAGYRYWRVSIDDITNPDGYLQIGIIVFGTSIIFNGECIVDELGFQLKDFSDTVRTEGFTNVANSRALKRVVSFEFRNLDFKLGNFTKIRDIFRAARTTLKCLWIPTPSPTNQEFTQRFFAFSKLSSIPVERHNNKGAEKDYSNFSIELDESL